MQRKIDDKDYLNYLPSEMYRNRYLHWKDNILSILDDILIDLETEPIDSVMEKRNLSPKDIALMVRLGFVTPEEVEKFDLRRIEQAVPV